MLTRRTFLASSALGLGGLALLGSVGAWANTTLELEISEVSIPFSSLPENFESYRIGFLSDIHFGVWMPDSLLQKAINALNAARLDLILLGGDFILVEDPWTNLLRAHVRNPKFCDIPQAELPEQICSQLVPLLSKLRCKDGVYAVPGNHDRWYLNDAGLHILEQAGVKFLVNKSISFSRGLSTLQLTGVDDFWTGVPALPLPFRKGQKEFRLLLSHNPDFIAQTLDHSAYEFDLGLAGHTHGGQILLPVIGGLYYNIRDYRFASGLYEHRRAKVFTSRGLGTVELPIRLNCLPEVSIITLTKGA